MAQRRFSLLAMLLIAALVLAACPQPTPIVQTVQETVVVTSVVTQTEVQEVVVTATPVPPSQGGVFIQASSADATILNPILSSDTASSGVHNFLYPSLLGQDAFSGEIIPTELAESWSVSDDGLVWTFVLRQGMTWSDGEQVDANDFKFTYDAIASDAVETPRKSNVELIDNIEVVDDYTLVVTFKEVKCDGLSDLGLGLLPSHLYAEDFSDIMTSAENEAPTVSAGPLVFNEWVRDDNVTLLRNESYFKGAPNMDGMIIKTVPDAGARLAQLQTGEIDTLGLQPEQLTTAQLNPDLNVYKFKDDGYAYIALNLANPENPQPGLDEDGNKIEQDPHPILSDLAVRQAIAHALDYETIINKVYLGQGYPMAANTVPAIDWAYNSDIQPYEYNTELAAQILEEAGWVDSDGDGVREKDGIALSLNLKTNAGNTTREDLGALAQDQLNSIGFDIEFEAIEFGTMVGEMLGQTFDMVIIGWTGLGTDPNDDSFWALRFDTPGSGFNFVSYSNDRVDELLKTGLAVPGCDPAERAPYYKEIQQIIHDEIPYVFVTGSIGNTGYTKRWQGIDP
ncbi:MAG: ABC transporter substrate-binding protein, partial [Caldilineaceae bacterium]